MVNCESHLRAAGAGFVAGMPDQYGDYQSGPLDSHLVHARAASLGTAYLVITLPVTLLRPLNEVFSLIQSHVERAFQSVAVITPFEARAGKQGIVGAMGIMDRGTDSQNGGSAQGIKDSLMSRFSGGE